VKGLAYSHPKLEISVGTSGGKCPIAEVKIDNVIHIEANWDLPWTFLMKNLELAACQR
jgi:hypothetical protein